MQIDCLVNHARSYLWPQARRSSEIDSLRVFNHIRKPFFRKFEKAMWSVETLIV